MIIVTVNGNVKCPRVCAAGLEEAEYDYELIESMPVFLVGVIRPGDLIQVIDMVNGIRSICIAKTGTDYAILDQQMV